MNLQLKKFNPKTMRDNSIVVFIAKRMSGKSTCVKDIMYHKRSKLAAGVVMSGTEEGNGYYKEFIPDLFVYNEYKSDVIEKLIASQKNRIKKGENINVFTILDDCMYDKND